MIIRETTENDYLFLEDFLYNAIFLAPGEEAPLREIIFEPEIFIYIDGFGSQSGDHGVVAEQGGKIIGMAWTRIIPAYGHIDNKTPELAISVLSEYRGQGVGTILMTCLFDLLLKHGYRRTSLSVQKDNPAVRFYERLGYKFTDEKLDHVGHEDYIMMKKLTLEAMYIIERYTLEHEPLLFSLIEREGEEWKDYWRGDGKAKYQKALANSIVYVLFDGDNLCGYIRCRDDDGYGVYVYDLLVDKGYRGKEYGRLLMEQVCRDFPETTVYVLGDVYPYYEKKLGYDEEGKIYIVKVK